MNVAAQSMAIGADNSTSSRSISRALLVIPRIYIGVILLISDLGKLTRETPFANEMLRFLRGATRRASAPYIDFVQQVVVPHAGLFSYLVMTAEAFAAISLLTGTLTRVGAAVAGFLFLELYAGGRPDVLVARQRRRCTLLYRTRHFARSCRSCIWDRQLSRETPAEVFAVVRAL